MRWRRNRLASCRFPSGFAEFCCSSWVDVLRSAHRKSASRRSAVLSHTETRASRLSAVEHAHTPATGRSVRKAAARGQRSPRFPSPVSNPAHASPDSDDAASSPTNIGLPSVRSQSAMFLRRCCSVNALTSLFAMPEPPGESGDFLLGTQPATGLCFERSGRFHLDGWDVAAVFVEAVMVRNPVDPSGGRVFDFLDVPPGLARFDEFGSIQAVDGHGQSTGFAA